LIVTWSVYTLIHYNQYRITFARIRPGSRGFAGTGQRIVLRFSRHHAQTPEQGPSLRSIFHRLRRWNLVDLRPAGADPAIAVRGGGLPGARAPGAERMALLPHGDLARPVRPRAPGPPLGRIGTQGHRRLDPHPDPGAAINALAALLRAKRRRGYQDRTW
jgi:WGR domain